MSPAASLDTPAAAATSQLDQLKNSTVAAPDTRHFHTLTQYAPRDATTNPSLILTAVQMPEYQWLVDKAITDGRKSGATGKALVGRVMDDLLIAFGCEILKIVP